MEKKNTIFCDIDGTIFVYRKFETYTQTKPEVIPSTLRYLKEQVEEHDKTQTWVDKLAAFGEDKLALRLLDNEMGE